MIFDTAPTGLKGLERDALAHELSPTQDAINVSFNAFLGENISVINSS